jgi:DNA polymerase-3 subunit alpha
LAKVPRLVSIGSLEEMVCDDDSEVMEQQQPRGSALVTVCGMVTGMKIVTTRKGDQMAFITVEDESGHVEAAIFPEMYKIHRASLNIGQDVPIVLHGALTKDDTKTSIAVRTLNCLH